MPRVLLNLRWFEHSDVAIPVRFTNMVASYQQLFKRHSDSVCGALVTISNFKLKIMHLILRDNVVTTVIKVATASMRVIAIDILSRILLRCFLQVCHKVSIRKVQVRQLRIIYYVCHRMLKAKIRANHRGPCQLYGPRCFVPGPHHF